MSRWQYVKPSIKTAAHREWAKTPAGIAYRKKHAEYARKWRLENRSKFKASQKRSYNKIRYECLSYYCAGKKPFCKCCGEYEILFLHIDHINGDGAEHRRKVSKENGYYPGGNGLPYWLKKHNYPKGFQVLCANCNLGKRLAKDCPHKLKH